MSLRSCAAALACSVAVLASAAPAAAFDAEAWDNQVRIIQIGVITALDDQFYNTQRSESWEEYHAEFEEALQNFEVIIDKETYAIIQSVLDQLKDDFERFPADERWQDARDYIESKFELVSETLRIAGL